MNREVLINVGAGETRIAVVEDARLQELILERQDEDRAGRAGHSVLGNIYLGRVQRVLPGMQAAFVDVGLERAGFLGAREAQCLAELAGFSEDGLPPIARCVHEGEVILVQAVKDPIGDKGVRLSANVTMPGRLLVFVPNQSGVALSRRIEDEAARERLTTLIENMIDADNAKGLIPTNEDGPAINGTGLGLDGRGGGYIVRTAALDALPDEVAQDARAIREEWTGLQRRLQSAPVPSTLFYDLDPVAKSLRDHVDQETTRVLVDDLDAYGEAKRYSEQHMPEVLDRLHHYTDTAPLFSLYNIEEEIDEALEPRVTLPHGGWITVETTEALTSVDVNSGSYTSGTGLEETSLHTNIDAAREIMRQLRLRGIGGLIVIDFIHMNEPENIARVLQVLEEGTAGDRTPTQISPMNEFGIAALTRKRVREPLAWLMTERCNSCAGTGRKRTIGTIANDVIRRLEREAKAWPGKPLTLVAAPEIVEWFNGRQHSILTNLRKRVGASITLRADQDLDRENFDVAV